MASSDRTRRFRYDWSRTWDDKPEDYACADGEVKVGRVYRINSIAEGGWFWTMNALVDNLSGASSGQVADRDEACRLVEEHYLKLRHRAAKLRLRPQQPR